MKTLADLTAPAEVVRKRLEKDIQKQCVDWARARGYWARKFSSQSQRSVPDYLFAARIEEETDNNGPIIRYRVKFACEFKKPGNRPTDAQLEELEAMRKAGWLAFWIDNFGGFKAVVEQMEAKARVEA